MIPFASQRGGGQDLATHLLNDYDNDLTEVDHVRGAIARDLHGAFKEWEVQADTLTKCQKYLYSVSINPDPAQGPLTRDQYMDYIGRTEQALGLSDQPRAVVFHVKEGREHCHVVWSRIDVEQQKAVHIAFDRDKLMQVTRGFARDHGLTLPAGYEKSRHAGQISLYELTQQRQTGLSKEDHKREVTSAWQQSDDARSFVQALTERGYLLATGKQPYVVVDLYGGMFALPRLINDEAANTKQLRTFLSKDFPFESLPSVEEAQQLVAAHRQLTEKYVNEDRHASLMTGLKHSQQERRSTLEQRRAELKQKQHTLRLKQISNHKAERDQLRSSNLAAMRSIRQVRHENRPTGLAAFLGKVSGVTLIQKKLHQVQDARKIKEYLFQRKEIKTKQAQEQKILGLRFKYQSQEIDRKIKSLEKIDKRELAALSRDQSREQRVRDRGNEGTMPSLANIAGQSNCHENEVPNLLATFARAKQSKQKSLPDLIQAFKRATQSSDEGETDSEGGSGLDKAKPLEFLLREKSRKNSGRNRNKSEPKTN